MKSGSKSLLTVALAVGLIVLPKALLAEKLILADIVPRQEFKEKIPVAAEPVAQAAQAEDAWGVRLSPGLSIWFFDEEDRQSSGTLLKSLRRLRQ